MSIIELIIWMQSGLLVLALMPVALIFVLLTDYFNKQRIRKWHKDDERWLREHWREGWYRREDWYR